MFRLKWSHIAFILMESLIVDSTRPLFREDYRYEKGFHAFYKVHHAAADWFQARIRCEGEGADLMVPENLDEADALPLLISTIKNRYDGVFVGINDLYSKSFFATVEGYEIHDSILDLLWEYEEPRLNTGRCLAMHHNGRLFVQECTNRLPYICKIKAANITYHEECDTFDSRWTLGPNNTCYLHHTEPQNWHDAFATCLSAGGNLAVMNSRTEAEFVRGMFQKVADRRLPDNDFAFIGFHDLFHQHQYRTVHGDNLATCGFTDWSLSCGKTVNGTSKEGRCGGIRRSGLLAVSDCYTPAMFICEKKLRTEELPTTESAEDGTQNALRNVQLRYFNKEPRLSRNQTTLSLPTTTNIVTSEAVTTANETTIISKKSTRSEASKSSQFIDDSVELKTSIDIPVPMEMEDKMSSSETQAVSILSDDVTTSRDLISNESSDDGRTDLADPNHYW